VIAGKFGPNGEHMDLIIEQATFADVDELLALYLSIYGDNYPLEIGTKRIVMENALSKPSEFLWLIIRDNEKGSIAGSTIIEIDLDFKIGKVTGVTTHKNYRGQGIASKLIEFGTNKVVHQEGLVNSLYATSRTISKASQVMFLKNGFKPLGIFPNARKIKSYETLTLLGYFGKGVIERRKPSLKVPAFMKPISDVVCAAINVEKIAEEFDECPLTKPIVPGEEYSLEGGFEFISAPHFIKKRFDIMFQDDDESVFYPFHKPNLLIASVTDDFELYASFNEKDHYCVIITANEGISELGDRFKKLLFQMKDKGIYYVETLVRMDYSNVICFLAENKFLPSAVYPAMREEDGYMYDYVLLTRTMVPLDFSETQIDDSFKPYVAQYAKQWIHMNLAAVEGQL
jgi:RimJ/RimL family protein N-acetyltransferase